MSKLLVSDIMTGMQEIRNLVHKLTDKNIEITSVGFQNLNPNPFTLYV
jgi:hypothetical protein